MITESASCALICVAEIRQSWNNSAWDNLQAQWLQTVGDSN